MTAAIFGDVDPADAWDADPTIAAEQVTYRLHEIRVALAELAGRTDVAAWDQLGDVAQQLAAELGAAITASIVQRTGRIDPATVAHELHQLRARLDPSLPEWADLPADHHQVAVDITGEITAWLTRQGPR